MHPRKPVDLRFAVLRWISGVFAFYASILAATYTLQAITVAFALCDDITVYELSWSIGVEMASIRGLVLWFMTSPSSYVITILINLLRIVYNIDEGAMLCAGPIMFEALRSSLKARVQAFALTLKFILYLGIHPSYHLPASDPVKYPVSYFITHMFDRFAPTRLSVARATYKRVNPTTDLKLQSMRKFDNAQKLRLKDFEKSFTDLADEYASSLPTTVIDDFYQVLGNNLSVRDVGYEGSSAAGYPFKSGTKRRDAFASAANTAESMLVQINDGASPGVLFKPFFWLTTGRAKLIAPDSPDSARLICYQAFSLFLIMQKYADPFTRAFVKFAPSWSAIGFSWFNAGASKLMHYFGANRGRAPTGSQFASLDISNWDAGMQAALLRGAKAFHLRLLPKVCPPDVLSFWQTTIDALYEHMIEAKVILPGSHVFQLHAGMKSGWNLTSIDNTIIHEVLFRRAASEAFGFVPPHKLYGDDNLFLAPLGADFSLLENAYLRLGCIVKYVHSGTISSSIDFLSKFIYFDEKSGEYYPFRATVETDARLLMPEHYNPLDIPAAEPVAAAEAIVGHLIDNFFNLEVRDLCYKMLNHIKDEYNVQEVDADRAVRAYRYKGLDIGMFRTTLPTVLDPSVIASLYGLPLDLTPSVYAGLGDPFTVPQFDYHKRSLLGDLASVAEGFSFSAEAISVKYLGRDGSNGLKKLIRSFSIPLSTRGTAGAKVLEAIKRLGVRATNVLDIGGHPGSVACALLTHFPAVTVHSVSKMFARDKRAGESFMYKAPRSERLTSEERDALTYVPKQRYSVAVVDVGFEDVIDDVQLTWSDRARIHISRLLPLLERLSKTADHLIITTPALPDTVVGALFPIFMKSSSFDIFKPLFSYGWNTETVISFSFTSVREQPLRKRDLIRAVRSWRNSLSSRLTMWSMLRMKATMARAQGWEFPRNPVQQDETMQGKFITHIV